MLQLLTTTGCRPEAFEFCKRWMNRQMYSGPVRWIIVDDGEAEQNIYDIRKDWQVVLLRPEPYWQPGQNTQKRNLLAGLSHINDDEPLVIIEDDDYYSPGWLELCVKMLKSTHLFGESFANYYNVTTNVHKRCPNDKHASLCATAMIGKGIQVLRESVKENDKFIDIKLWKNARKGSILRDSNHVVGIKGLPGRENIGIGKRLKGQHDSDLSILKRLVGEENAKLYDEV